MKESISEWILLNNNFIDTSSINDSIVEKGTSFYEVIRVINSKPFFVADHLQRLQNSLKLHEVYFKINRNDFETSIKRYISKIDLKIGNIKLIFNVQSNNDRTSINILIYQVQHYYPTEEEYKNGVIVGLLHAERLLPNSKFINFEIKKKVTEVLNTKNVFEILLVDSDQCITEGSKSNVFFVKDNIVYTPPEANVLPGVTRKHIKQICKNINIKVIEQTISINNLIKYDAVFLTGTSSKVLPVKKIENVQYSVSNHIMKRISEEYNKLIEVENNN